VRIHLIILFLISLSVVLIGCGPSKHKPIDVCLTVESEFGAPTPPIGANHFKSGTVVDASVVSPVAGLPSTRYVCTGWTSAGSVPLTGFTNSVTFEITQNSSITWTWKTQYYLMTTVSPSGSGIITPPSDWYDANTVVSCNSVANPGYTFFSWSGDLSGTENPTNLTMNSPKSVAANFDLTPVADFAATPTSGYVPLAVQFTEASTGTVTSWAWDFENNGTVDSTEQNPTYTYWGAGIYSVKLTVTGPLGNHTVIKANYVTVVPLVSIIVTGVPDAATMKRYRHRVPAVGGIKPYTWQTLAGTLPTGLSMDSTGLISGIATADGAYNFTVKCADTNGIYDSQELSITVKRDWTLVHLPARDGHAMAYDSARGEVVLFGGSLYPSSSLNDTWEWDGTNWVKRDPIAKPSARYAHAMAYDSRCGVVVLFGGYDGNRSNSETWEWDGTNWTQKFPANKPSAQAWHAMAYDSTRGVVVLFGAGGDFGETWEWDGTNWTKRNPANKPPGRVSHAVAYDSTRGVVVLFGGYGNGAYLNDTWEWDGIDWTQRFPTNAPSVRWEHAMAYDSTQGVVLLFGGRYKDKIPGDTWEWDGTNWVQRNLAIKPRMRHLHAMACDSTRGVVVIFGGYDGSNDLEDTWEWDGTNWVLRNLVNKPPAQYQHAVAYDCARGVVVLFGGYNYSSYFNDTWEWDGAKWAQKFPTNVPSARSEHAMAYDSTRGVVVLFGGSYGTWQATSISMTPGNGTAQTGC
jgi:PKD repeat protein